MNRLLLMILFLCVSCSAWQTGPKRESGSCFLSSIQGGPFLASSDAQGEFVWLDPIRKKAPISDLKNDSSWEQVPCPF